MDGRRRRRLTATFIVLWRSVRVEGTAFATCRFSCVGHTPRDPSVRSALMNRGGRDDGRDEKTETNHKKSQELRQRKSWRTSRAESSSAVTSASSTDVDVPDVTSLKEMRKKRKRQRQQPGRRRNQTSRDVGRVPVDELDADELGDFASGEWNIDVSQLDSALKSDELFEKQIDSFLAGEHSGQFQDDDPSPHPGLEPSEALEAALRSLRKMDDPFRGAAVFLRFCSPLICRERWGGGEVDPWKKVLRQSLTPQMLTKRLRASPYSGLLDWQTLDISVGIIPASTRLELGVRTTIAFVNAALYFGVGVEPSIIQFTMRKVNGAWLIDTAMVNKRDWYTKSDKNSSA